MRTDKVLFSQYFYSTCAAAAVSVSLPLIGCCFCVLPCDWLLLPDRSLLLAELEKEEKEKDWYYAQLQNLTKRIDSLPLTENVTVVFLLKKLKFIYTTSSDLLNRTTSLY